MSDIRTKRHQQAGGAPSRHRSSVVLDLCLFSHLHMHAYPIWGSAFTAAILQDVFPGERACTGKNHVVSTFMCELAHGSIMNETLHDCGGKPNSHTLLCTRMCVWRHEHTKRMHTFFGPTNM
jgi:hypothetical protein